MKNIILSNGLATQVDDSDFDWLSQWNWYPLPRRRGGWAATTTRDRPSGGGAIYMHRLILGAPPGTLVDHRDGNGLNNQRHNLRLANHSQNSANSVDRLGTSRFKGVHLCRQTGRWRASIMVDGRCIHLGRFYSEEAAAEAYAKAAISYFGEFARVG